MLLFDIFSFFFCTHWADCCDGSDEYDGKIKCPNTCWEAGKTAREKLKKKISTFQEGSAIRKQEIERTKQEIAKEEAELSKLKKEEKLLKDLVDKLKGILAQGLVVLPILHFILICKFSDGIFFYIEIFQRTEWPLNSFGCYYLPWILFKFLGFLTQVL